MYLSQAYHRAMSDTASTAYTRTGHVGVKYKNVMVIWGGYKEDPDNNFGIYLPSWDIWIYEPISERWYQEKSLGQIPPNTSGACGTVVGDYLYVFGGFTSYISNTNKLYRLNLETLEWTLENAGEATCIPVDKLVGWEHNKRLYYFGGFGPFDRKRFSMPRARDFGYCIDTSIHEAIPRAWNNQFICYDLLEKKWSCPKYKGSAPSPRAAHAVAKIGNVVYVFGGRHSDYRLNDLHMLNMDTMTWTKHEPTQSDVPMGRSWHSLTALNSDTLVLYGGFSQNCAPLGDCWFFNTKSWKWKEVKINRANPKLFWHSACTILHGEIICCGGCCINILEYPENALQVQSRSEHYHSSELCFLYFSPKPLLKLCLDAINKRLEDMDAAFKELPRHLRDLIKFKIGKNDGTISLTPSGLRLTGS